MSCGGSVSVSLYCMDGATMKQYGVRDIVTRSQKLGEAIRKVKSVSGKSPEEAFLEYAQGYRLFKGKIVDVLRETKGAFNYGKVVLEGIGNDKGHQARICLLYTSIRAMKPDSLTVHSLAIKRAARLNMFKEDYEGLTIQNTPEMIDLSAALSLIHILARCTM